MIPLYTQEEFDNSKTLTLLPLQCKQCSCTFYKTRHEIKGILNPKTSVTGDYCSKDCQTKGQNLKQQVECKHCSKLFLKDNAQIIKHPHHFCSRSCSAIYNNKHFPKRKTERKCTQCENTVKSYRHSLCSIHHEEYMLTRFDYIKELTLEDYWNKESVKNLHPSSKNSHIRGLGRNQHKNLLLKTCYNCGYDKHVELCHIKPIRDFLPTDKIKDVNSPKNVIQLCPNCHWEFDNKLLILNL